MISIWAILQILLVVEIVFALILTMNILMPVRRLVVKLLRLCFHSKTAQLVSGIVAIILLFTFAFTYYTQNQLDEKLHEATFMDATKELSLRVRIFREQRNMYISGLAFFHGIFLWRLVKLYESVEEDKQHALEEVSKKKDQ